MAVNVASWFHLLWACVFALVGLATAAYAFGVYRIRKSLRRKATHVVTVSLLTVFATIRSVAFFIRAFDFDYLPHPRAAQSPWINLVVFVVPAVALHALYTSLLIMWQAALSVVYARRVETWLPRAVVAVNCVQLALTAVAGTVVSAIDDPAKALLAVEAIFLTVHAILVTLMVVYARRLRTLGRAVDGPRPPKRQAAQEEWHDNPITPAVARGDDAASDDALSFLRPSVREGRRLASRALRLFFVLAVICTVTLTAGAVTLSADIVHIAVTDVPIGASPGETSFRNEPIREDVLGSLFNVAECVPAFSILLLFFTLSHFRHREWKAARRSAPATVAPVPVLRNTSAAMFWGSEGMLGDDEAESGVVEGLPPLSSEAGTVSTVELTSSLTHSRRSSTVDGTSRRPSAVFGWSSDESTTSISGSSTVRSNGPPTAV